MAGVATGVAPFLAAIVQPSRPDSDAVHPLLFSDLTTFLNLSGTRLLARVAMFGFVCELVGAIVVGGYLLLFARQPAPQSVDGYVGSCMRKAIYWPAFLASSLAAMFCYYGFEACGDVAEEHRTQAA